MPPPNNLAAALSEFRATVQAIHDAYPGLTDDDLRDTCEGESGKLEDAIIASLRAAIEREACAAALGAMIEKMTARKSRFAEGAQALRVAALNAMIEAGLSSIPAPDLTVTVSQGRGKLVIPDTDAVPDIYCRIKREPDKKLIAALIHDTGGHPSWATFDNGQKILTVRRQ